MSNAVTMCGRLLFLRTAVQRYTDTYSDGTEPWVIGVEDWNLMSSMRALLSPAISCCKDLEADLTVTCSKMLKRLFRLWKYFEQKSAVPSRARSSVKALGALAQNMAAKLHAEIDDPNWFFTAIFMAYMDPTGGAVIYLVPLLC